MVSTVATPLMLPPAKETAPSGMLTGKPIKYSVATLHTPVAMLKPLKQHLTTLVDPMSWSTSPSTFNIVLAALLTYFGLCLGGRTVVPMEPKVLLENLGVYIITPHFVIEL